MKDASVSLLDRVTGGRGAKAIRYTMVSAVTTVVTQAVLVTAHAGLGIDEVVANVVAVSVAAVPGFVLNKRWVWRRQGPNHIRREVLPFWVLTLAGLGLSTLFVAVVSGWTDSTAAVSGANIAGFAVLWVAKFLFLDAVLFGPPPGEGDPGAGGDPAGEAGGDAVVPL